MAPFKNLVFDIGNVIVDIDYNLPITGFGKLSVANVSDILTYAQEYQLFHRYERGQITERQFQDELRPFLRPEVTDEDILAAWNSILINYPAEKFELLNNLKERYRVYALSNINETHVRAIDAAVQKQLGVPSFSGFFHTAYYSNEMGHRKPEKEIYEFIAAKENLNPAETFFVDDLKENIEAARSLGWQAYHLPKPADLIPLLTELKII